MFEELLKRQFRIDLLEKDKSPRLSFSRLKYNFDYPMMCKIVDSFTETSPYHSWIYGKPLPKEIKEVANSHILINKNEIKNEINWILLSIRKHKDEINKFLQYKKSYDISLMNGDYQQAENILNLIEEEICVSLWSIENRFLMIELRKGLKENTNFLNEINTQNQIGFIQHFAYFYSIKAEKELSVNRYEVSLLKFILPHVRNNFTEDIEYYLFKLNPLRQNTYNHLPSILAIENYNSIIDKYLTLIQVLQLSFINLKADDSDLKNYLGNRLFYLRKKINDKQIEILYNLCVDIEDNIAPDAIDKQCSEILDLYTEGDYSEAEDKSKTIIDKDPLMIELYPIYIKSIILQKKELEINGNNNSYKQVILSALYDLYKKDKNPVDIGIILKKIAYNLSSIGNVAYFLINIVKQELENDISFNKLSIIKSSFLNPNLAFLHSNPIEYIQAQLNFFPISTTLKLLFSKMNGTLNDLKSKSSVYNLKYNQATDLQNKEDYSNAANIWINLLSDNDIHSFQKEEVLINLFFCKTKLAEFDYCIQLFVNNYFDNKYLTQKFNVGLVKEQIKKEKYRNVKHSIELPLFYFLTNSDDYDIHITYECFLLSTNSEKPSELIAKTREYNKALIFFLKNICTLDIFKHSPFITSTRDKLNERVAICQVLNEIDSENKLLYSEEEALLTKRLIIQKGLQEIDESKIYVNHASIIQNELKDLKSVFNRYVAISQLSSEKKISVINIGSEKVFSFSMEEKDDASSEFSKDPQYDIFKEMFFEIRDKFLYSKYGLKLYLSARIRHGVLLGEIRPEFELLHLVTEKEKASDNYKPNLYWQDMINAVCGDFVYDHFNNIMSIFSKRIDGLINDELLSKYLLIKTEKENPDGWFDYEFDEIEMQIMYVLFLKNDSNYDEFVNLIFEQLWIRTDKNLQAIRYNIKNGIRDMFFDAIQTLEASLREFQINSISELQTNLTDVRVKIENKLDKIAQWFTITDSQIADFEFNKIIEVCCESLHNHYTSKELVLDRNIIFNFSIKGQYYTHFVDLVRILLQNILDYTLEQQVNASISVSHIEDKMIMRIENPLRDDENIEDLKNKINIDVDVRKSQLDKKSGLYKAMNIVKTNFENENNELKIDVKENKFSVLVVIHSENILV